MGNMSGNYGSHYTLWASITQNSQNKAANTSNVTARLYLSFDGSSYWASQYDTTYGEMKINRWNDTEFGQAGATEISELAFSSGVAKDILLASWTGDVPHNSDGEKTFIVKGSWNTNTSRIGSGTCEATKVLTPIVRKATITSAPDFQHGSNASITIDNPSGSNLTLEMKIGSTQILTKTVKAGANTISFTDTQLDKIYKLYGNNNSKTVTYTVTTAAGYSSSRTCTVTLKGNQKTIRSNVSGTWRRGKIWVNINGTWRRAVVWIKVSGTWRRCI